MPVTLASVLFPPATPCKRMTSYIAAMLVLAVIPMEKAADTLAATAANTKLWSTAVFSLERWRVRALTPCDFPTQEVFWFERLVARSQTLFPDQQQNETSASHHVYLLQSGS